MRTLLLNPIVLPLLIALGVIALILLGSAVSKKEVHSVLCQVTIFLFLFTGLNVGIFPFVYLYPEALAGFDKTLDSALLQLSVYAFFTFILRSWFAKLPQAVRQIFRNPFLGVLIIYILLAGIWSGTPLLSLKRGAVIFFTSLLSAHFASGLSWKGLSSMLRRIITLATTISLIMLLIAPSSAVVDKGLTGIFPFPIRFGTCLSFGVSLGFIHLLSARQNRWKTIGGIGFLVAVLPLTNSAQSFFTSFALVSLIGILKLSSKIQSKYIPLLVISYLGISILLFNSINFLGTEALEILGKDATLSGRTDFWPQLLDKLMQRPLQGYGIGGFWQPWQGSANPANGIVNSDGFVPPNAHSGFFDLALELGLVGFVLFCAASLLGFAQAIHYYLKHQSLQAAIPLVILVYIMLANVSETQLLGSNYIWMLYVMSLTLLSSRRSATASLKVIPNSLSAI
jgi:O-antigen ligase